MSVAADGWRSRRPVGTVLAPHLLSATGAGSWPEPPLFHSRAAHHFATVPSAAQELRQSWEKRCEPTEHGQGEQEGTQPEQHGAEAAWLLGRGRRGLRAR